MIIKNLRVEEGFFNNLDLEFSNGLNVLVGGRGVGKTSVIELLRFGLGADNLIGEGNKSSANHALSILQSSGRVSIDLELPSGEEINVTRSAQDNIPLTGSTYIAPIIFSQKEIETIGVTKIGRLSLIDSFIPELKDTNFKINELNVILRSLSAHYYAVKQEFNDISDKTTGLENLKNRELELQKKNDYLQENNHKIKKNQNEISIIQKSLANYSVQLQNIAITRKFFEKRKYDLESIASVNNNYIALDSEDNQELMLLLKDRLDYDNKLFKYLLDNNDASLVEIDNFISEINHKKVNLEIEARKTRTQVDNFTEGAGATLSELGRVREQLAQISNYSKIAKQKDEQLNNIYQQMQDKLLEIYNLRDDIYKSRTVVLDKLNENLCPNIKVVCNQQTHLDNYMSNLEATLRGSGLKYKELLKIIAYNISPQWLLYYSVSNRYEEFASILDIPTDRAIRLLGYLSEVDLGLVLSSTIEDSIDCMLLDHGQYKSIEELSIGQRCTVALSIILENTSRILIIDQPEDHLDNEFVVQTLIKSIRQRSGMAQTIISSHNANIPVLGNASKVINLDSNGRKGFIRAAGTIDNIEVKASIESIMEGGREAFQHRSSFYSS